MDWDTEGKGAGVLGCWEQLLGRPFKEEITLEFLERGLCMTVKDILEAGTGAAVSIQTGSAQGAAIQLPSCPARWDINTCLCAIPSPEPSTWGNCYRLLKPGAAPTGSSPPERAFQEAAVPPQGMDLVISGQSGVLGKR